ncbi:MAG TPA: ATP-binding protein [Bryobacteraceae bacterium]
MRMFRDIPIKQKLVVMIMLTTAVALLWAGVGIIVADLVLFRSHLERDLSALAQISADNSTAALAFNDPDTAAETLAALRARTHVIAACVYRPDGTMLAKYSRKGAPSTCPPADAQDGLHFSGADVKVSHAILLNDRRIGTLVLLYDLLEISERIKIYGATVLGVMLISSLIAFLLSSRLRAIIEKPISQLVAATTAVSETGDYSIRATKLSGDELGVLVDRFNQMLAGIQSRDDNLTQVLHDREEALREAEQARERFRFMAESMPQKIFTAAPSGDVDYFNRQWMEFTGLSFDQIKSWGWTQFIHPDDIEENVRAWRKSIETGAPFHFQHRFRRADGAYRWHLSRAHAMRDDHGRISMWIGSNTDIHEQKEKEEELRQANDDLQQFAYSASHDLQEPIRNVAVYSEVVAKRYQHLLDADGQQFLGFLTEGGRRLVTLINDLLAYTRAGIVESNTTAVDASAVLEHALASLAEAIRESDATVTYDPLPEVYMGQAHLQQLFQNLIGNALKYRKELPPRIHIAAGNHGAAWRFSVQDNGIGIDSQYKEKIFGVFKRLHRDQKYGGTGIGLAICQRVVERYGGRIWVESEPGKGATFFFTVPQHAARVHSETVESSSG